MVNIRKAAKKEMERRVGKGSWLCPESAARSAAFIVPQKERGPHVPGPADPASLFLSEVFGPDLTDREEPSQVMSHRVSPRKEASTPDQSLFQQECQTPGQRGQGQAVPSRGQESSRDLALRLRGWAESVGASVLNPEESGET